MKFKVDENLPAEHAEILRDAGHEADSVADQSSLVRMMRTYWSGAKQKTEFF